MVQISLKIDEEEDPVLAKWVKSFQGKKTKELSANIRRILRRHIDSREIEEPDQEGKCSR
jgi:hypothetical protein